MSFDISTLLRCPAYDPKTGTLTKVWQNFYQGVYPAANWGYGTTKAERAYFDGANVYTGTIVLADAAADFDLGTIAGDLDDLADGSTYAKTLATSLSEGLVLLSQAAGDLDDLADGESFGKVAKTDISAGHILLSACDGTLDDLDDGESFGKVAITDISSGHILLASCTGDLDDIANGEGFGKVSITDISEGHILLASCDGDLDDITDGSTYGKVLSAALYEGSVLLSAASGSLDDVSDGENYSRVAATDISEGHILLSEVVGSLDDLDDGESYGRVAITDISSGHILLAECTGDLDDISDGSSYGKVASTSIGAGKIIIQGVDRNISDVLNPGNNLLVNPGFETAGTSDALAWTQGANISREITGGSGSNCFLRVTRSGTNRTAEYFYPDGSDPRLIEVNSRDVYEFGATERSSNGSCLAKAYLAEYNKNYGYITSISLNTTSQTWYSQLVQVKLNASTKFIHVRLVASDSDGYADFDNIILRKYDSLAVSWGHSSDITQINGGTIYTNTIVASALNVSTLSSITANIGTVTAGVAQSSDSKVIFDLTNKYLKVYDADSVLRVHLGYIA